MLRRFRKKVFQIHPNQTKVWVNEEQGGKLLPEVPTSASCLCSDALVNLPLVYTGKWIGSNNRSGKAVLFVVVWKVIRVRSLMGASWW